MIIKLKDSKRFIPVSEGENWFYGGNQAWFTWENQKNKTLIAQKGGCGTVASANITAYLAQSSSQFTRLYAYKIGSVPLGVWPLGRLADGVERFAWDRGVRLYPVWQDREFNRENVIQYIGEGLERNLPVAMVVGTNRLCQVPILYEGGRISREDIYLHWVTVTELCLEDNLAKVKAATWGGWAEFDLDAYMKERVYGGVLYFDGM